MTGITGRPGHVAGARIETSSCEFTAVYGVCRPGHVAGARIETRMDRRTERKCGRPGHVAGARIETFVDRAEH